MEEKTEHRKRVTWLSEVNVRKKIRSEKLWFFCMCSSVLEVQYLLAHVDLSSPI